MRVRASPARHSRASASIVPSGNFTDSLRAGVGTWRGRMPRTTDWRSQDAVDALLELDRADLAWEFLRRNPDYREDFRQTLQRVATGEISEEAAMIEFSRRWGYPFARDPNLPANESPTIWRPELIPSTVVLVPAPEVFSEAHELSESDFAPARGRVLNTDGVQTLVEDHSGHHSVWLREPKEGQ